MPWHLKMLFLTWPLQLLAYLYLGITLSKSITLTFRISLKKSRRIVFYGVAVLNLFPVLVAIYYLTDNLGRLFLAANHLTWLDYLLVFPYWWGMVVIVESLFYYLSLDIAGVIIRLFKFLPLNRWRLCKSYIQFAVLLFFIFYVGFRMYEDTYYVRESNYRVSIQNLPPALENFRLTLLSDIQIDRFTQETKINRLQQAVKKSEGDVLLFAGDVVTAGQEFITQGLELLCDFPARLQRIACLGDHDFWADPEQISGGLRQCGWTFLRNRHHLIEYHGEKILITGITQIYSKHISHKKLIKLLSTAPHADLKIVLVHQPSERIIEAASRFGYQLLVAGHTHGGQIVFRPFGFSLTPSRLETSYFSGYYRYKELNVIVTNGVGLTFAPVRYNAPAQVSGIVLQRKKELGSKIRR